MTMVQKVVICGAGFLGTPFNESTRSPPDLTLFRFEHRNCDQQRKQRSRGRALAAIANLIQKPS